MLVPAFCLHWTNQIHNISTKGFGFQENMGFSFSRWCLNGFSVSAESEQWLAWLVPSIQLELMRPWIVTDQLLFSNNADLGQFAYRNLSLTPSSSLPLSVSPLWSYLVGHVTFGKVMVIPQSSSRLDIFLRGYKVQSNWNQGFLLRSGTLAGKLNAIDLRKRVFLGWKGVFWIWNVGKQIMIASS